MQIKPLHDVWTSYIRVLLLIPAFLLLIRLLATASGKTEDGACTWAPAIPVEDLVRVSDSWLGSPDLAVVVM